MVVATLDVQLTDKDPSRLVISADGDKVALTTESRSQRFSKKFARNDVGGADKWAREVAADIKRQVEAHRIDLPTYKKPAVKAYCMKCRTQREMKDPKPVVMKNSRPATQGVCPDCGTKLFRIGKG